MIERGDAIPSIGIKLVDASGISETTSDAVLGTGTVVFFAVPGAFTPTCHVNHLPGFLANAPKLMKAWATASEALGTIDFVADGNAELAAALGLAKDFSAAGMGTRYARSAMIVRDGRVADIFVEDAPGVNASGAPAIIMALEAAQA
jgi:peroxiredoxin